jgi:hypothetical protein
VKRAIVMGIALCLVSAVLAGCKRKGMHRVLWEGSPTSLMCSEDHRPSEADVFTCVGNGRVYTCIRSWHRDALTYSCGQVSPPLVEVTPSGR